MTTSPDQSTFASRFHLDGRLTFASALRIGASRSIAVDEPDLPVLRTADGRPYVPGSSMKGALRSYVESVSRTLQARPDLRDRNLACLSVGKPPSRPPNDPEPYLCLTQGEVSELKATSPLGWDRVSPTLRTRLPDHSQIADAVSRQGERAVLDRALRDQSCWCCRVFGSPWLASKVLIKDLVLDEGTFYRTEIRDGVGIDRDSGRAADGVKYQFEVVPVGAAFCLDMLVDNASEAELGLLWLGVNAFMQGEVLLGGAKSRGLGWCKLTIKWDACRYVTPDTLLDSLLPPSGSDTLSASGTQSGLADLPRRWVLAFFQAIGAPSTLEGGNHA